MPILQQISQQQGLIHESHSIPLQDGPGVSDMWWLWIKSLENCQRTYQEMSCSSPKVAD